MGWLWYLITLLPVIGLIQVGAQAMADRYTYVPSIGFFIMLVWCLGGIFDKFRISVVIRAVLTVGVLVVCILAYDLKAVCAVIFYRSMHIHIDLFPYIKTKILITLYNGDVSCPSS